MITETSKPGFTLVLPGPSRKRLPSPYNFKIAYRSPDPNEAGCVAVWEVMGGREGYQIALERTEKSQLRWHCCCPDAVYRQNDKNTHYCKHVQGLFEVFETIGTPVCQMPQTAVAV
jgi:hypothetical protein